MQPYCNLDRSKEAIGLRQKPAFNTRDSDDGHVGRRVTPIEHLALIGNFLPRKCGIATYTTDTFTRR